VEDGALDAGLRVRVVVLDAVQQLAQAPVRVRLHLAMARACLCKIDAHYILTYGPGCSNHGPGYDVMYVFQSSRLQME